MKAKNRRIAYFATSGGVVLAAMCAITIAASKFELALDSFLGRGEKIVSGNETELNTNYITFKCKTQEEALANAQDVTRRTAEEGMTLLKNKDGALPLQNNEKVTVLGYYSWHNNMSGGEDPATTSGAVSLAKGIKEAYGTNFNEKVEKLYSAANGDFDDPAAALASAADTFDTYSTAIVTLKRNSGEGNDQPMNSGAAEQERSNLVIKNAELKLIDFACKKFKKVIVVINAANAMELGWLQESKNNSPADIGKKVVDGKYKDPYTNTEYDFSKVQGAIWAGCCGSQGGVALANILKGTVNPSGHLVDTYVRDIRNDPTTVNFGSFVYENSDELNSYQDETFFVTYEEGIYVGYRYYETACYESEHDNYAGFSYDDAVVYPFGYGLSYTSFSRELAEEPAWDADENVLTFKVKVTNTGEKAGKGLAQIYVNTPYTKGGVEKAHVVLVGFAKTQELQPNASEIVTIEVNKDYFTNYDYKGEKCYILDAGAYNFYVSDNAHSWHDIDALDASAKSKVLWTWNLADKVVFKEGAAGKRNTDYSVAVNKEDEELNYMFVDYDNEKGIDHGDGYAINFSRKDFAASFPKAPEGDDLYLENPLAQKYVAKYDVWADENNPISEEDRPSFNVDKTNYKLAGMRGLQYNDQKWDDYMDQFTLSSLTTMVVNGGWNEKADEDNGVPESYDADSPYGFYAGQLKIGNVNKWYCGDPMVAATFNPELAREIGNAFGEEAWNNRLAGTLITGLYGYGLNMHRSAYGGRNYEYYAEDGILEGKMGAAEATGASEKGLITFMKHFCLNDQEENRQKNGYCAWVNEQAFREVYLKGWELYMKEAKMEVNYYASDDATEFSKATMSAATGIMTSYNRIGATWGGASVSIQGILQQEFNFTGTVLTDAGGEKNTYMTSDFMIRRGGDLTLCNNGQDGLYDTVSATAQYYIKDAARHILFNKANSNCVQGLSPRASVAYKMSPWKVGLIAGWAVIGLALAADAVYIVLVATNKVSVKERKEPEEEY